MAKLPTPRPHKNRRKSGAPRPHERRAAGSYPYYRLAVWDARSFSFKDCPKTYETTQEVTLAAIGKGPGRYKVTAVFEEGADVLQEFYVKDDLCVSDTP